MYAYKTNSADYLDYVASVKSRKEIMADPDLCLLLENELIRDNMEMAIRWNEAKYGDYQDKYDFMEYFMCNGPQLDADTILHYRMKAYNDPVCMEIAYSYLSDTNHIAQIRKEKYQKQTDNCFKNPCFYMGKFSAMMGSCGDLSNTNTAFNMVSRWVNSCKQKLEKSRQQQEVNRGQRASVDESKSENKDKDKIKDTAPKGSDSKVDAGGTPPSKDSPTPPPAPPPGSMRHAFQGGIISGMWQGCKNLWAQITTGNEQFTTELIECTNAASNAKKIGDKLSQPISEMLDLVTKANVRRQLGDCSRLWSHVRRLHLFSNENKYGPIVASQIVSNTNTNGTPKKVVGDTQPTAATASTVVKAAKDSKTTAKKQLKERKTEVTGDTKLTDADGRNRSIVAKNDNGQNSVTPELDMNDLLKQTEADRQREYEMMKLGSDNPADYYDTTGSLTLQSGIIGGSSGSNIKVPEFTYKS